MPSFDTVCEANLVEVKNAVENAAKEIATRFDFKGTSAALELKDKTITLFGDAEFQLVQVEDILRNKLTKRNVDVRYLDPGDVQKIGGDKVKQAMEVRNGIGGTLVADFSATGQALGATSWSDGLGTPNTWTVGGTEVGVRVTSDRVRFWGELTNLPQRWDTTGTDVTIPALATGMLRRLSQGAKPLDSAMTRNTRRRDPYAWWALEDGSGATSAASGVSGGRALTLTAAQLGDTDKPPGSKSALAFTGATSQAIIQSLPVPTTTGVLSLVFYMRMAALPATKSMFASFATPGTARRIEVGIASGAWYVDFYDSTGAIIGNQSVAVTPGNNPALGWVGYNLLLEQSGADLNYSQRWDQVGVGLGGGVGPVTISSATVQPINSVRFYASGASEFQALKLSQVFLSTESFELSDAGFRDASNAYFGETAVDRQVRLCAEEGISFEHEGFASESETMGFQTMTTFPDLMNECWEADGGVASEARDALFISYRTRADLENNNNLTVAYPSGLMSEVPQPDDGDQGLLNDVTVRRSSGSTARVQVIDGPNSINSPTATPPGVGVYDTDRTLNVAYDDRLPSIAGWIALVGSWDADRYPLVAFGMHRQQLLSDDALFAQVMKVNLGDTLTLSDMPSWMSPDDVPEIVQGIDEVLGKFLWEIKLNCTPGGPYRATATLGDDTYVPRLDATSHTTGGSLTTTATSVSLVTPAGSARWVDSATYPGDFPMDIVIGGEVMSLTAVTGTSSPQTGTVTRSINGIVKSHSSGALVRLARPFYIGR